jgi:hypothetical protein
MDALTTASPGYTQPNMTTLYLVSISWTLSIRTRIDATVLTTFTTPRPSGI